ncbi:MAG: PfkB family carbohydrate kinase [Pyrinomonadaceae bacterium]|nr:PfkB family carbohydrate kinase [Pyrinomonadaceae bacterium]
MPNISDIIRSDFPRKKIVIVGDLVADQFLHGTIARVSREAPVFILRHNETETLAGGAANAAVNVASLGGGATLVGLVGKDLNGDALMQKLQASKVDCRYLISSGEYQTTTKVRVLAGQHYAPRQQVIRIDYENTETMADDLKNQLSENLRLAANDADAIVISDYNYGVANAETAIIAAAIARDKKIPLLVDSRFRLKNFPNATTATPNQEEVEQILGKSFTEHDCIELCRNLGYESLLITRGNLGMLLIETGKTPLSIAAVGSKEPVDVTGAGDTVIAAYALSLASGLSFAEAANLANHAGGAVVMKKGTASVSADELLASLTKTAPGEYQTRANL